MLLLRTFDTLALWSRRTHRSFTSPHIGLPGSSVASSDQNRSAISKSQSWSGQSKHTILSTRNGCRGQKIFTSAGSQTTTKPPILQSVRIFFPPDSSLRASWEYLASNQLTQCRKPRQVKGDGNRPSRQTARWRQ